MAKPAPAWHFIGFKDDRVWAALKVWGPPDFWHRTWDARAASMLAPGDVAVFAEGDEADPPKLISFDDSQHR